MGKSRKNIFLFLLFGFFLFNLLTVKATRYQWIDTGQNQKIYLSHQKKRLVGFHPTFVQDKNAVSDSEHPSRWRVIYAAIVGDKNLFSKEISGLSILLYCKDCQVEVHNVYLEIRGEKIKAVQDQSEKKSFEIKGAKPRRMLYSFEKSIHHPQEYKVQMNLSYKRIDSNAKRIELWKSYRVVKKEVNLLSSLIEVILYST